MSQEQRTNIIQAGLVFILLLVCGVLGYLNGSGRVPVPASHIDTASPVKAKSPIKLQYCADADSDLCITSFGRDSAQNSLIVIKSSSQASAGIYLRIKRNNFWRLYECRRVELLESAYYCVGDHIPDGENVTVMVYSKNDNRLISKGILPFAAGIASLAQITVIPPTETPFTGPTLETPITGLTPRVTARNTNIPGRPTATATRRPSYPNPTSYP